MQQMEMAWKVLFTRCVYIYIHLSRILLGDAIIRMHLKIISSIRGMDFCKCWEDVQFLNGGGGLGGGALQVNPSIRKVF